MTDLTQLQLQWETLCSRIASNHPEWKEEVWKELLRHYNHPSRHYHNFQHLAAILNAVNGHSEHLQEPDNIRLATWFHDLIYQFTSKDNEARSAERARERLEEIQYPESDIQTIERLILRTKDHYRVEEGESYDLQFFLDCDLGILAVGEEAYSRYMKAIRAEYKMVPDLLYKPNRKKVLKDYFNQPWVFRTAWFRDQFESRAKANLAKEMEALSS